MTTDNNTNNNTSNEPEPLDRETLMVECHHTGNTVPFRETIVFYRRSRMQYDYWLRDDDGRRTLEYDLVALVRDAEQGHVFFVHEDYECDYGYCADCGAFIAYEDSTDVSGYGDYYVCETCIGGYEYCESHDNWHGRHDMCDPCADEDYERDQYGSSLIHDYSYRPSPTFHGWNSDGLSILIREPRRTAVTGFELEMEATDCEIDEGAQLAVELYGDLCYLKHDGSLNNGFEMVSHPMTLDYIRNGFDAKGLRKLALAGMRSAQTRTCGLHVHINKGFFDGRGTSLYRFMSMFYNNPTQWQTIAGRTNSSYANWHENEKENMVFHTRTFSVARNRMSCSRYVPVNVNPSNTVELRFFKGTLRPESLMARLEAVHAVAQYAIETRNNINIKASHDWERFRQWTEQNGFDSFNNYAKTKGV